MYFQSKLHYNIIFTGSVDQYCLVCDTYLRSEDEAFTHTEKPIHKKNMSAAIRLEKFKDDQIIKVKKGYYCIYCNILLTTATKVALHVSDVKHQENKGVQMLNQIGDNVIAFDEVAITQESWHGMFENTCLICNKDFDNGEIHRCDQQHLLNLIQSKCQFGEKYIYRNVDQESFFCLTCGNVFSISDKTMHHDNIKHNTLYNSGKELKNKIISSQATPKTSPKIAPSKPKTENEAEGKVLSESIKSTVDADAAKTSNTAITKKAETATAKAASDVVTFNITKKAETVDAKKAEAKKDTIDESASNIPITKDSASNIPETEDFTDDASKLIKNFKDSKTNDYLNVKNFMIRGEDNLLRCLLCDIVLSREDVEVHLYNDLHHLMMLKKHKETLHKKENGQNKQINETIDNIVQNNGKNYQQKPGNKGNNTTAANNRKTTPGYRQLHLDIDPPQDIQSKIRLQNQDSDISSDEDEKYKSKILDNVDMFQQNDITIDFMSQWARCKRCKEDVPFNFDDLEAHIKKRHKADKSKEEELDATRIDTFTQENYMEVINNDVHCKLCDITMNQNMRVMVAHVDSNTHRDKAVIKRIRSSEYMKVFFRMESNLGSDIILNNSFVLRNNSFHCVVPEGEESLKCALCNVIMCKDDGDQLVEHLNTTGHKQKMGNCNIMCYTPDELIRELSPGVYHCGYCNVVEDNWPSLLSHIRTDQHTAASLHSRWSLERCHSLIRNARPVQGGQRERSGYNQSDVVRSLPQPQTYDQQAQTHPRTMFFLP